MKIGRIRRHKYIVASIIMIVVNYLIFIDKDYDSLINFLPFQIYFIVFVIVLFILNIGRLNDINLSGWYSLLIFVPIINLGFIALYFVDSTKGVNKYGKDPKGRLNKKKLTDKNKINVRKEKGSTSIETIENNLELLLESYNDGILNKEEFEIKNNSLLTKKQKLIDNIKGAQIHKEKVVKLNKLLENNIISQKEYDNKLSKLNSEYNVDNNKTSNIDTYTKLYYVSNGTEFGPYYPEAVIKLLNQEVINPNSYIRTENENEFTMRAFELLELFEK